MAELNDTQQFAEKNIKLYQKAALKLDKILNKFRAKAQDVGLDLTKNTSIIIGKETVYKGVLSQAAATSVFRMVPDKIDIVDRALSNPQSVKEPVRILHHGEKLFHVLDGSTIKDQLELSETQAQIQTVAQESSNRVELEKSAASLSEDSPLAELKRQLEDLTQKAHEEVAVVAGELIYQKWDIEDIQTTTQTQQNEINALKKVVEEQQITIDHLKQGLEQLSRSVSPL